MRESTAQLLVCPLCYRALEWEIRDRSATGIRNASARCAGCGTVAVVHEGVGDFRPGDARPEAGVPPAEPGEPAPPGWEALRAAAERRIAAALDASDGPRLEIVFRGFDPIREPGHRQALPLVATEAGARWDDGPTTYGSDRVIVEVHSLPLRDRSIGAVAVGPGLQTAAGTRVILRDLRRTVRGPLAAIVVAPGGDAGTEESSAEPRGLGALPALRDDFRRAKWDLTSEEVGKLPSRNGPDLRVFVVVGR